MDLKDVRSHWENWADEYGTDLRATTKSTTAKIVEQAALREAIKKHHDVSSRFSVLEVGCGNGHNCFSIEQQFDHSDIVGVDYISQMVENAKSLATSYGSTTRFLQGDVLQLDKTSLPNQEFDLVFTVRCLINLCTDELQAAALENLVQRVAADGKLMMIENFRGNHSKRNDLRESLGLEPRPAADFNHFMCRDLVTEKMHSLGFALIETTNFSSLHDILLYVLIPAVNGGVIEYEHPLVAAAAKLLEASSSNTMNSFGDYGQNVLLIFGRIA